VDRGVIRRLIQGWSANLYGQAVVTIIQLAGVPILLRFWGAQRYGEWLIIFAMPFYLSLTDLGFSQSAANDMTARVARGDRPGALTVFQSLCALVFPAALCGMLIVGVAASLLPLGNWFHFSSLTTVQVRWIAWLLAAEALVKLNDGIIHAGFRATGDYSLHVTIYYSTLFVQHASVWAVALIGLGPVAAAVAFFSIRAMVTPIVAIWLTRRHPWLRFGLTHAARTHLRSLLRPALANIGVPLAQALNIQGMVLLVGSVVGPLAVVTFSTLRTLTRVTFQLVSTVSQAAEPELAAAFGLGNRHLLRTLYEHGIRAAFWLALIIAAFLAFTGSWILQFWTHGRVTMHYSLFYWLLASSVATVLWFGSLIVLKAANRHLRAAIIYACAAGAALLLAAILLGRTHNLASVGMSLLFMDVVMVTYTMRAAANLCDIPTGENLFAALNPVPLIRLITQKRYAL
jgi:O-antigen/teichoic acid export membrane protein